MKKFVLTMMVALMATVSVCAQKVKRPDTYNFNRGVELVDNGELDEGLKYLYEELKENPKNGYAYVWIASAEYAQEEYSRALTSLSKAINLLPKKDKLYVSYAYNLRSNVYYALDDMEKAMRDMNECIRLMPEDTDYLEERAQYYYEREEYELSDKDYQKIIALDEGSVMGYMGVGRNAVAQGKYDEAIELFDYVVKMASDYSSGYSFRAEAYMKKGEYAKAADDIVKALDIDGNTKSFLLMVTMVDSAKLVMEAKLKAKSLKEKNVPKWHFYLGMVNESAEEYAKAIGYYKRALELYPAYYYAYRTYACYEALGDYEHALEYIDYSIELDSTEVGDLEKRAEVLFNLDRIDECLQTLDKFVDETPDQFSSYLARGVYREYAHDMEGAIEDFSMAIVLAPEIAYSYYRRAESYVAMGDEESPKADYLQVVELDTAVSEQSCVMFAYHALGELDKAKDFMQRVLDNASDDNVAYYNAACLYARMGETDKAIEYLRQSFEQGYRDFALIERDRDLNSLRDMEAFKALIEEYKEKYQWGVNGDAQQSKTYQEETIEVPFTKEGNMCVVKCTINNLPLHFIFDTGASIVSMSDVEATFMMKNGYLSSKDVVGKQHFLNADGSVSEGTIFNLRNVNFGGVSLDNIQASVVKNQRAPLLLGQTVMQKLGRIEIDNERRVMKIAYKKVVEN